MLYPPTPHEPEAWMELDPAKATDWLDLSPANMNWIGKVSDGDRPQLTMVLENILAEYFNNVGVTMPHHCLSFNLPHYCRNISGQCLRHYWPTEKKIIGETLRHRKRAIVGWLLPGSRVSKRCCWTESLMSQNLPTLNITTRVTVASFVN